jgi:hypothetical protein
MLAVHQFRLPALTCSLLTGCLMGDSVPNITETTLPNLPADQFLDVDAHWETVEVNYKVKTGETCYKGDCVTHKENRRKDVDVRVASGTIDGRPVSLRELAVAASPEFVRDTDKVSGLMSACRRGRIAMSIGMTAAVVGATLLQRGFDENNPNRDMAIGGYASLGAGLVGIAGGYTVFGGQHCKEAGKIYERWQVIYEKPNEIQLRGEAAKVYEILAKKFNKGREAALGRQSSSTPEALDEEVAP